MYIKSWIYPQAFFWQTYDVNVINVNVWQTFFWVRTILIMKTAFHFYWSLDQIERYFFYHQWYKRIVKIIKVTFRNSELLSFNEFSNLYLSKYINLPRSFSLKLFSYLVDIKWYHKRNWRSTLIYFYCVCMLIFIPFKQFQNLQ